MKRRAFVAGGCLAADGGARGGAVASARTRFGTTPSSGRTTPRPTSGSPTTTGSSRRCRRSRRSPRAPTTTSRASSTSRSPSRSRSSSTPPTPSSSRPTSSSSSSPRAWAPSPLPSRNRMVLPVDLPDAELQKLIQHELTHVFQFEILFQGKLGKALTSSPPQWFMEGMASYFADDEDSRAKVDHARRGALGPGRLGRLAGPQGYDAYRFGHMVFKFVESEWGDGGRARLRLRVPQQPRRPRRQGHQARLRPRRRGVRLPLPLLASQVLPGRCSERGDPREFGPAVPGASGDVGCDYETSPVASPSGDLIAAFSTYKEDVDVVLFGVPDRKLYRNLTKGNTTEYQYLVAQMLTVGPDRGRDLAFSPDGNHVAVFARRERGRDAAAARRDRRAAIAQASPDHRRPGRCRRRSRRTARRSRFTALRRRPRPTSTCSTSPPGAVTQPHPGRGLRLRPDVHTRTARHIVYSSQTGESAKLFELELADPTQRRQLTFGPGNDEGAAFSRDGKRLYFASDRDAGRPRHLRPRPRAAAR